MPQYSIQESGYTDNQEEIKFLWIVKLIRDLEIKCTGIPLDVRKKWTGRFRRCYW